jgi:uracil-DNA glycosylase family 4
MEPAKPARVESRVRSQVQDWLLYGAELGLGPYYRDRRGAVSAGATAQQAVDEIIEMDAFPTNESVLVSDSSAGAEKILAMPQTKILKTSAATLISPVHAERLFGDHSIAGDTLPAIRDFIGDCTRCKLSKGRTKIVFGTGNPKAELMFVGEGPGRDEDLSGEPFVGRAGKLLTDMIKAMGLQREDVYIANIVKCRPPENRQPEHDEVEACSPFLMRQIDVIKPKVICTLGNTPTQTLLQTTQGISKFRGEWFEFRNTKLLPTYHPAYLLRNPAAKTDVWKDLQKVMGVLGLQLPKKR